MTANCEGKVAVVTGAGHRSVAAVAVRIARAGARLCISDQRREADGDETTLDATLAAIRAVGGTAESVTCDLAESEDRRRLVRRAVEAFGPVDILVVHDGTVTAGPVDTFPEQQFKRMVEAQVWGRFELIQMVLPAMRAKGSGAILNITDQSAAHPLSPLHDRRTSRSNGWARSMIMAGVNRLTTAMAAELYGDGIVVNSLTTTIPADDAEACLFAEAALALCTASADVTGRVASAEPLLAELGRRWPAP